MKTLTAITLMLACCVLARGSCVVVLETKPSSPNARITVLREGKVQGNVKLIVNLPERQGSWSFVTDSRGIARLRPLPIGTSCITATADGNLQAGLCLDVSAKSSREISLFNMSLLPGSTPAPSLEDSLKAAEKASPVERVRQLDGRVADPAGAVITDAEITIYKHGSHPQNPVAKLKANQEGQFAASLDPGTYTVVIQRVGFKTDLFVIEVSPGGREGEVRRVCRSGRLDVDDDAKAEGLQVADA